MGRLLKKTIPDGPILATILISLTAVITYGVFIPRLGYYHDDWYMLWSAATRGPNSLIGLFSMDRPFMGVLYTVYYNIVGDSIAGWHIFALLWRIAGALAFYWILNLAWPKLKNLSILAAVLFVVFPGFLAEPNAATKINHLTGYAAALFSIAFTLQVIRSDGRKFKILFTILALLSMALYLWLYEYMIGLEVMRVLLMFWMIWQGERGKFFGALKKIIFSYLPYVLVIGIFLYWRVFIFESTRSATDMRGLIDSYQSDFAGMAFRLIFQVIKDFLSVSVFAWAVQPYQLFARASYQEILVALLVTVFVVLLAIWYAVSVRKSSSTDSERIDPIPLILIGAITALAAVLPVVLSDRHLDLLDSYKGYGLHPSAGVMIMVLGVVLALRSKYQKSALIVLLALSVITQGMNAQRWITFWDIQRDMWWQLTWRAPDIKDDTLVMAYIPDGFALQQDYEIWAPINLIYHPEPAAYPLVQSEVLNKETAVNVLEGIYSYRLVRDIPMPRFYENFLLLSQPTLQSCVHVVDGSMPVVSLSERPLVEKVAAYSNTGLIDPSASPPSLPAAIFGEEPPKSWCYYYQQASLARQSGDWQRIADLYDTATSEGLRSTDSSEYFVFLEGLVNSGRVEDAVEIANNAIVENPPFKYSICTNLTRADDYPESYGYNQEQIRQIVCK